MSDSPRYQSSEMTGEERAKYEEWLDEQAKSAQEEMDSDQEYIHQKELEHDRDKARDAELILKFRELSRWLLERADNIEAGTSNHIRSQRDLDKWVGKVKADVDKVAFVEAE
tara:strand:+ start:3861 stop:4196 length:336 start_codon:yes stop_codon:yes gene_type:complete